MPRDAPRGAPDPSGALPRHPDDNALTPKLTALDRKVLDHIHAQPRSKWQVAEMLCTEDVQEVRMLLDGLIHLRLARRHGSIYHAIPDAVRALDEEDLPAAEQEAML